MKKLIKYIKGYLYSVFIAISFALKRLDDELKADPIMLFKVEERGRVRVNLQKMMLGEFDERYYQYFYEVLKKADKFMRTSNPAKIQRTAGKFGLEYGMKDQWGRRFEHYGFFDEKHKYAGKSLMEVREAEVNEKKLKDEDDYPVIVMYHNVREFSFTESLKHLVVSGDGKETTDFAAKEIHELARLKKFPLTIIRDVPVSNKIEQLTEYLHVKEIDSKRKLLEFFIPKKFKLYSVNQEHPIFKEVINFKQVWFKDEYGDPNHYKITKFYKQTEYNAYEKNGEPNPYGFDVLKFMAEDVEILK